MLTLKAMETDKAGHLKLNKGIKKMKHYILKQDENIIGIYFTIKQVDEKLTEIYNKDLNYTMTLMQNDKVIECVGMEVAQ